MCSATLSMSMYSYGCVAAVGIAVCVSCIFLYNTTIVMITSAVITDNNTNIISTIVIIRIILTIDVSDCVVVTWTGVYSRSYTCKYKYVIISRYIYLMNTCQIILHQI